MQIPFTTTSTRQRMMQDGVDVEKYRTTKQQFHITRRAQSMSCAEVRKRRHRIKRITCLRRDRRKLGRLTRVSKLGGFSMSKTLEGVPPSLAQQNVTESASPGRPGYATASGGGSTRPGLGLVHVQRPRRILSPKPHLYVRAN